MVDRPLVVLGRDEAERDSEHDREEPGGDRELDRRGEPLPELRRDRLARGRAVAEVQRRQLPRVPLVLDVDRLVEPVLVLDRGNGLGSRALAEKGGRRARPEAP